MPRFFFDLDECGDLTRDEEGCDLPDFEAARTRATSNAREIMAAEVLQGRLCLGCRIFIRREDAAVLGLVTFRESLAVSGV